MDGDRFVPSHSPTMTSATTPTIVPTSSSSAAQSPNATFQHITASAYHQTPTTATTPSASSHHTTGCLSGLSPLPKSNYERALQDTMLFAGHGGASTPPIYAYDRSPAIKLNFKSVTASSQSAHTSTTANFFDDLFDASDELKPPQHYHHHSNFYSVDGVHDNTNPSHNINNNSNYLDGTSTADMTMTSFSLGGGGTTYSMSPSGTMTTPSVVMGMSTPPHSPTGQRHLRHSNAHAQPFATPSVLPPPFSVTPPATPERMAAAGGTSPMSAGTTPIRGAVHSSATSIFASTPSNTYLQRQHRTPPPFFRHARTPQPSHNNNGGLLSTPTSASASQCPRRSQISGSPYRVLDAPDVREDSRYQLLDWGDVGESSSCIVVVLGGTVYGYEPETRAILYEAAVRNGDQPTIVKCFRTSRPVAAATASSRFADQLELLSPLSPSSYLCAVGYTSGVVDVCAHDRELEVLRTYTADDSINNNNHRHHQSHPDPITAIAAHDNLMAVGCESGAVRLYDVRCPDAVARASRAHAVRNGVASLAWSCDGNHLACGSNAGDVLLWHERSAVSAPPSVVAQHCGVVRAMAWNPHQRGVLASGALSGDGVLRLDNTIGGHGQELSTYDTGCSIYGLFWSRTVNEIVAALGEPVLPATTATETETASELGGAGAPFAHPYTCVVWEVSSNGNNNNNNGGNGNGCCTSLSPIATLRHAAPHVATPPVVYMGSSPDGSSLATVCGETLRVWQNVFPAAATRPKVPRWLQSSVLR
eukprot:PhM_4_TR2883/c3_g1_i1/m.44426/K03364/CDH1; cell division cycle 20-like protein 1, cofactor of APC complex